jgi:hypothetical protein
MSKEHDWSMLRFRTESVQGFPEELPTDSLLSLFAFPQASTKMPLLQQSRIQAGEGKEAAPKEVFREGINTSLLNNPSQSINADCDLSLQVERRAKGA